MSFYWGGGGLQVIHNMVCFKTLISAELFITANVAKSEPYGVHTAGLQDESSMQREDGGLTPAGTGHLSSLAFSVRSFLLLYTS